MKKIKPKTSQSQGNETHERQVREEQAMLAKHLRPPVVTVFKGIRF